MGTTTIYRASSVSELLKSARESSANEEFKTKTGLSKALGIDLQRLRNIEDGFSHPEIELIRKWCELTGGDTEFQAILNIFGVALPPTDPRLLVDLDKQLVNFIEQAKKAIEVASTMLVQQTKLRPDKPIDKEVNLFITLAEIFFDIKQATESVIKSLEMNYRISEQIEKNWLQKMLLDNVLLTSVDKILDMGKENRIQRRMAENTVETLKPSQWTRTIPKPTKTLKTPVN